jgi:CRP-like cAMP-binding protein
MQGSSLLVQPHRGAKHFRRSRAAFDQLCRYAKHFTLKRGATICSKGDPGNSLIAVISGHGKDQRLLRGRPQRNLKSDRRG